MGTFDVVGVDLQLRVGVDQSVVREQEVLVGLLRVRLLGIGTDDDPAVENSPGRIIEDSFVELPAALVRLGMVDHGMMIDVLAAPNHVKAVQGTLTPLPLEARVDVVAHQATT